jgi:hypothetical protein
VEATLLFFSPPVAFLNDRLKAELGMKANMDDEENDVEVFSLKVPVEHKDKDSKTYMVKIKKYDTGTQEEFLRWRVTSNEQTKSHVFSGNYEIVMNFAQAMLAGRGLEEFLSEQRAKDIKNKTHTDKEKTEYTPQQIYDCGIFELTIRAFDIQSGWRDAFERQREYMRTYISWGNSTHKNSAKDCKILTSIWITPALREQQLRIRRKRHMDKHCQMTKSGPLWDDPSHLNGQCFFCHRQGAWEFQRCG